MKRWGIVRGEWLNCGCFWFCGLACLVWGQVCDVDDLWPSVCSFLMCPSSLCYRLEHTYPVQIALVQRVGRPLSCSNGAIMANTYLVQYHTKYTHTRTNTLVAFCVRSLSPPSPLERFSPAHSSLCCHLLGLTFNACRPDQDCVDWTKITLCVPRSKLSCTYRRRTFQITFSSFADGSFPIETDECPIPPYTLIKYYLSCTRHRTAT